ncbi:hypothetical protein [Sphingomonas koreensis]
MVAAAGFASVMLATAPAMLWASYVLVGAMLAVAALWPARAIVPKAPATA